MQDRLESGLPDGERLIGCIVDLYVCLTSAQWSEAVRLHATAALAAFVTKFGAHLMCRSTCAPVRAVIARTLLRQLSCRSLAVQRAAAALTQLVLRVSYEKTGKSRGGLGRMANDVAVAMAHMLGGQRALSADSPHLHRGLTLLHTVVSANSERNKYHTHFDTMTLELIGRLRAVLTATAALRDADLNTCRLAELHLKLADSYRGSASLRHVWLESLATIHEADRHFTEAAMCHMHIAALIAVQLAAKQQAHVTDWAILSQISENITIEERDRATNAASDTDDTSYTLATLTERLETAASTLAKADRHEALGPLYRLLTPIYEQQHDYVSLVECYSRLHTAYEHIRASDVTGRNALPLATYFRVAFRGQCHFDDDHGLDYVYAWAACTSLAEASESLRAHTALYLRHDRIRVIAGESDDDAVDQSGDESVANIHMTHVHACPPGVTVDVTTPVTISLARLLAANGSDARTGYEIGTNVTQFMYETKMADVCDVDRQLTGEQARVVTMGKRCVLLTSELACDVTTRLQPPGPCPTCSRACQSCRVANGH